MSLPGGRRRGKGEGFGPGKIYELFYLKRRSEESEQEPTQDYAKFVELCRRAHERSPYRGKVPKELRAAIDFLGWDIPPEAVISVARLYAAYAAVIGVVFSLLLLYFLGYVAWPPDLEMLAYYATGDLLFWLIVLLPVLFAAGTYYSVVSYPVSVAKSVFHADLLPSLRVVGNIVLSMKLVPNLEKAISFAVEHGRGFLANELKQMLWDVQLGMYRS
ncbi:TPA: hypothetical protein EYP13_01670, partial [Candidatus Micrarchaeota archaeon]|nr:hypothetical protein [Candidatus Micrarchaeota archaeon]